MPSPDLSSQSDDELFNPMYKPRHETVETLPLRRPRMSDSEGTDDEALETLPLPDMNRGRQTQPTQIIDRVPQTLPTSPAKVDTGFVQVAASSPIANPPVNSKSAGILASVMAPVGTAFKRPFVATQPRPPPITIDSDDEGPTYRGGSSDSDGPSVRSNDIKTATFVRKSHATEKIPESPQIHNGGRSRFMEITARSIYQPSPDRSSGSMATKRSADVSANAYGNVSKRPRQTGPSRALPVSPPKKQPEMELDDISDYNMRQKVKRIMSMVRTVSTNECYETLLAKRGNFDDAVAEVLQLSERRQDRKLKNAVDLTGSEDELMPTPAAKKSSPKPPVHAARQQAKAPQRSIAEKWGSTQNVRKPSKAIDVFNTPPPQKKRTLVRGRRRSSSLAPEEGVARPTLQSALKVQSDDSDEGDSDVKSGGEDMTSFDARVLDFFNTCSIADMADLASITRDIAKHLISQRPFKSLHDVSKVQAPNLKPSKGRKKTAPLGEKILDKVETMLQSYEAVDYLVKQCENLAKPLATEMKTWGVNLYGSQEGELEIVSLQGTQRSSHDSGIGTPVSDEDRDIVAKPIPRSFIGQPSIMSQDIQMKDYQIVGVNWLNLLYKKHLSCILADDMGLGKTCQVIAFLASLLEQGRRGPHLVVVPAATLENWLKEFQRFCPTLNVEPYYDNNPSERVGLRENLDAARAETNVIVTTYTLAKGKDDFPWLKNFGFDCTVYDEGHYLKNAESQVASKLVRIQSNFRLLLTGTPLQNNLKELISLLGFLMPAMFKDKSTELSYIFKHNVKALDDNHEALLSSQRIKRARSMLTPFILRRKKYQVLKDLPKKDRRVEYCDMTPEQSELYQLYLDKAYSIRERKQRGENVTNESANILMKLRQAAIHPMLFRRLYPDKVLPRIAKQCLKVDMWRDSNPDLIVKELEAYSDMEIHVLCNQHPELERFALKDNQWLASGKVQKMVELLRKFMSEGHKTLIFSQFVMVLDILELVLEHEQVAYFRLDGNTKVSERQDLIDEFSADDNQTPVFMLSTKAGGAGINLAKANKVIVFDSGFNPQDDIQAENRAHRIGQVKDVEVVRLVTRGSVEEQIYAMGLTKLKLDEQVAGEGSEGQSKQEGEDTDKEIEGRMIVEEMLFQKLNQEPIEQVKAEAASPVKTKATASSSELGKEGLHNEELDMTGGKEKALRRRRESVDLPTRRKS